MKTTGNKIARFETAEQAEAFAEAHNILSRVHASVRGFILISFVPQGVCAAHENGQTGEILTDW